MTTLANGQTVITLPADLLRTDAHGWSPVRQSVDYTLDGALWIDVSVAQAGEPITLSGGQSGELYWGAMTRAAYAQLRALADAPGQSYTLTHLGAAYQVVWRHHDAPALDAVDVIDYADPTAAELVLPTLKFTVIS
ncbi:MAG: hypothetical protein PHW25_14555 [Zoogloea sp.]|uniref:hypothetical protein n=1 Tax=Zoogloea sp. TaxID=49181 RepID=UPI00261B8570|nr:hypothetical protein [Zoogloea sp.]MDD3328300.1 hypothetical protein [Zoogloea sp.]